ncbi:hypothetical protein I6F35_33735 [Bradyrhizobium sp. BRP22]|uniref:phage adaptor protein n=1 Tax=Bradyrhizobium sp. BRP22 TaxID=2793821 RepID=UPI001CD38173|nr:hypothetical protein [Bradyrhizobium sp. BRP22]MCA1458098.1 hypothetical protein [Bradyrhizobium sp. BRP22]
MPVNYTTLTADKSTAGSIRRWVNYSQLDVEQVVLEAQALIYQTLRVREMRTEFSDLNLAPGAYSVALPAGFLDPIALQDKTHDIEMKLFPESNIVKRRSYDESGAMIRTIPFRYAIFDEKIQLECAYEEATTLTLVGFKIPALLDADNQTNFLTNRYPHLLRVACLAQAYDFMSNNAKYQSNLTLLSALIDKTNAESDLSYRDASFEVEIE